MKQRKAYSYLRFSTPEQMKGDSYRRQTALAIAYAAKHNLLLDNEVTFQDPGVSAFDGRNKDKGKLGLFLEAVRNGVIANDCVLLVESLDRISRETARHAIRTLEDICDEGVTVVTLIDGKEYTKDSINDPMTFLYSLILFMRANEESATKASRLRAAWQGKREKLQKGEKIKLTSRCPAWLRPSEDPEQLFELIPERAKVVKNIFDMSLAGTGDNLITQTLNKNNVPTFGRSRYWRPSYIRKILTNTATYGVLTPYSGRPENKFKREVTQPIENYFPPVISKEEFETLQLLKNRRNPRRGRHYKSEVMNVLGGLARCPKCRDTMTRVLKNKKEDWVYLICARAKKGAGCEYRSVRYSFIETAIFKQLDSLIGACPKGSFEMDEKIEEYQNNLEGIDFRIGNLLDALQRGFDKDHLANIPLSITNQLTKLEKEKREIVRDLDKLYQTKASFDNELIMKRVKKLRELTSTNDNNSNFDGIRSEVNAIFRSIFSEVIVDYDSGELHFKWVHGGDHFMIYTM